VEDQWEGKRLKTVSHHKETTSLLPFSAFLPSFWLSRQYETSLYALSRHYTWQSCHYRYAHSLHPLPPSLPPSLRPSLPPHPTYPTLSYGQLSVAHCKQFTQLLLSASLEGATPKGQPEGGGEGGREGGGRARKRKQTYIVIISCATCETASSHFRLPSLFSLGNRDRESPGRQRIHEYIYIEGSIHNPVSLRPKLNLLSSIYTGIPGLLFFSLLMQRYCPQDWQSPGSVRTERRESLANMPFMPPMGHREAHQSRFSYWREVTTAPPVEGRRTGGRVGRTAGEGGWEGERRTYL